MLPFSLSLPHPSSFYPCFPDATSLTTVHNSAHLSYLYLQARCLSAGCVVCVCWGRGVGWYPPLSSIDSTLLPKHYPHHLWLKLRGSSRGAGERFSLLTQVHFNLSPWQAPESLNPCGLGRLLLIQLGTCIATASLKVKSHTSSSSIFFFFLSWLAWWKQNKQRWGWGREERQKWVA